MQNKFLKKLTALAITVTAITTSAVPVLAQDYTEAGTADIAVTATVSSSFTVGIPTSVILTNDTDTSVDKATGSYTITASGDIDPTKKLVVAPKDTVNDQEGINFQIEQAGNTTNKLQVNVNDPTTEFTYSTLNSGAQSVDCTLETVHRMAPGDWSGVLQYEISLQAAS